MGWKTRTDPAVVNDPTYLEPRITAVEFKHDDLVAKMSDNATQLLESQRVASNGRQCVVTFINDDCPDTDYAILRPIFEAAGVPCTMAITTGFTGVMTDQHVQDLHNLGWEFGSHTVNHDPALINLTEVQIEYEMSTSKKWIEDRGLSCDFIVYPHNDHDSRVRKIAKKYFKFGVAGGESVNSYPVQSYAVKRITCGAFYGGPVYDLTYYKQKFDLAYSNKQWIVYMLHGSAPDFDATQRQYLQDLISYIKSTGTPILNVSDAWKLVGNHTVIGDDVDATAESLVITNTGEIKSPTVDSLNFKAISNSGITINTPLSLFEKGKVSTCGFLTASVSGFPENNGGILFTHYNETSSDLSYQMWFPVTSNKMYKRKMINSTDWGVFELVGGLGTYKVRFTINALPSIPANGSLEKDVTITNAELSIKQIDTVIFNTIGYYEDGIVPTFAMKGTNLVKVRLRNVSNAAITPAQRDLMLTVIPNFGYTTATVTGN